MSNPEFPVAIVSSDSMATMILGGGAANGGLDQDTKRRRKERAISMLAVRPTTS